METTKRIGTKTKHIELYHSVVHDRAGTLDEDGSMQTDTEIRGRHSASLAWNGFELLLTLGFTCNPKTVSHEMDLTAGWLAPQRKDFAIKRLSASSRIRDTHRATAN